MTGIERLALVVGMSLLWRWPDLSVVLRVCVRVGVMLLGRIVEIGVMQQVFGNRADPYTKALLSAVPLPDPAA
ncbi:peptide ABC transporter ATP-binding protein, partial [Streptomyces sp. BE20]|nr:peptide ABC transporter ATP-binding protein [Streptomyces sp. BE20]